MASDQSGSHLRAVGRFEADFASPAEALAHLLACLDHGARILREIGSDVDAYVIEAHRAQLAAGREWPGQPITPPFDLDGNPKEARHA